MAQVSIGTPIINIKNLPELVTLEDSDLIVIQRQLGSFKIQKNKIFKSSNITTNALSILSATKLDDDLLIVNNQITGLSTLSRTDEISSRTVLSATDFSSKLGYKYIEEESDTRLFVVDDEGTNRVKFNDLEFDSQSDAREFVNKYGNKLANGLKMTVNQYSTDNMGIGKARYRYDISNSDTDDGGSIIGSGTGRWVLDIDSQSIDPAIWGAHGVDDYNSPTEDFTTAIKNATKYAAANELPVMFGPGVFRLTDSPFDYTSETPDIISWQWRTLWGNQKQNQFIESTGHGVKDKTTIVLDFADSSKWLYSLQDFTSGSYAYGPIEFNGFIVKQVSGNGIRIGGIEASGTYDPTSVNLFAFGIRIKKSYFTGIVHTGVDEDYELIQRDSTTAKAIELVRCYESEIEDCAFRGFHTQVDTRECDNLLIRRCRSLQGWIQLYSDAAVPTNVENFQFEGTRGVSFCAPHNTFFSNCRFENGYSFRLGRKLAKYSNGSTVTGSISAFADQGGGTVRIVTDEAHGLSTSDNVWLEDTTNYNGKFAVTVVNTTAFDITTTWAGDDATGTWTDLAACVKGSVSGAGSDTISLTLPTGTSNADEFFEYGFPVEAVDTSTGEKYLMVIDELDSATSFTFLNYQDQCRFDSAVSELVIYRFFGCHGAIREGSIHNSSLGYNTNPTSTMSGDERLPICVVVPGGNPTSINGIQQGYGSGITRRTKVEVAGWALGRQFVMSGGLNWADSSPHIAPDVDHPFINFDGMGNSDEGYGINNISPEKVHNPTPAEAREWLFTPRSGGLYSYGNSGYTYIRRIDNRWCWHKRSTGNLRINPFVNPIPQGFAMYDIEVSVYSESGGETYKIDAWENPNVGSDANIFTETLAAGWNVFRRVFQAPEGWQADGATSRGLYLSGDGAYTAYIRLKRFVPTTDDVFEPNFTNQQNPNAGTKTLVDGDDYTVVEKTATFQITYDSVAYTDGDTVTGDGSVYTIDSGTGYLLNDRRLFIPGKQGWLAIRNLTNNANHQFGLFKIYKQGSNWKIQEIMAYPPGTDAIADWDNVTIDSGTGEVDIILEGDSWATQSTVTAYYYSPVRENAEAFLESYTTS